jgi:hypothetical protein
MNVTFMNWDCKVIKQQYGNGRVALQLVAAVDDPNQDIFEGDAIATATVNMPEVALAPDEVIIKDYSENEGILDVLLKAGIVELTGKQVQSGFVTCPICVLCMK